MAHHVARQLGQADLLGRDGQRFLDVDTGYDDGLGVAVVRPDDGCLGLALLRLAEGRALTARSLSALGANGASMP